jgi:hypothetical protein
MKYLRTIIIVALVLFITAGWSPPPAQAQGAGPVLVYYYAWWAPEAVGAGKSPDWPVTPYSSWDTAVIQQHVSQIASAGIDGMVVAWYGPTEENNQTETNFRVILDQAAAHGTTALLSVDLGNSAWFTDVQEVIDGLNYALSVHANHPAYFRYNGRPVLFFWFQGRYSLDDWAYIRSQVDPDHNSIWIAEGAAPDTIPIFDGLHMYTISWSQNVYGTLSQWSNTVHDLGGIWVSTAMPGWDNTYTQQSERYIRERGDGAFYRETFSAAAASGAEMIVITSWNEWWEGTHIEPSHNYGDFYLKLTRELIGEYKSSGAVAGGSGAAPPVQPTAESPPEMEDGSDAAAMPEAGADTSGAIPPTITAQPSPTYFIPPTITPTLAATITPIPTVTPQVVAEAPDVGVQSAPDQVESSIEVGDSFAGSTTFIISVGLIIGAAGLFIFGVVGILLARRRARR